MDLDTFIKRIKASNDWTVEARGCKFLLRLPSGPDISNVYFRNLDAARTAIPNENRAALWTEFAKRALIGWDGVTAEMIYPGGKDAGAVPFSKEVADWWLDQDSGLAILLGQDVEEHHGERVQSRDIDAKNSDSASTTKETKTKRKE